MEYKKIMLFVVLLSAVGMSCAGEVSVRQQELEKACFEKELELSNLGKMIDEKIDFLDSFTNNSQFLLKELIDKNKIELEQKNKVFEWSKEEESNLENKIRNEVNDFLFTFYEKYQNCGDIRNMLVEGLFYQKDGVEGFEKLKFFLVLSAFEHDFLKTLVKRYEACVQDLINIKQKLNSLEA